MLKKLFAEQREYINTFFDELDLSLIEKVFQACLDTKGLIILMGVGKSGIIAEKIAMTLISTGSKALYLPSSNFLHGDIGIISPDDIVLMLSKSGETEELLHLIPFIKRRGAKTVAVVSNLKSRLAVQTDYCVDLPVIKELCPFDLAPTISTEVQLLFGDVLSIALMKQKEFSFDSYGKNHPSGSIGKKIYLTVEDLMIYGDNIPICHPGSKLVDLLVDLSNKKCSCLIIVDRENNFLGIFTDGDLRRALQSLGTEVLDKKIEDLMTSTAQFVEKDKLAWEAMKLMQKDPKKWIMVLPVLEKNKVIGVLRMHDIIHAGIS